MHGTEARQLDWLWFVVSDIMK